MPTEPPTEAPAVPPPGKRPLRLKLPIALIVIGLLLGAAGIVGFVLPLVSAMSGGEPFEAPGTHTVQIEDTGPWAVYYETSTMSGGAFTYAPAPPNATITVIHRGQRLPVASNTGMTMTVGSSERQSLVTFEADTPGEYQIDVMGDFPARTFYAMPNKLVGAVLGAFGGCGLAVVGVGSLIGGIVVLIVRLANR